MALTGLIARHRLVSSVRTARTVAAGRRSISTKLLRISEEVEDALKTNKPVVALESAIYTHGFPSPDNIKLAEFVEGAVRDGGAIPATIAILDGVARVGLSKTETEQLCNSAGQATTTKVSRRDLAHVIGLKEHGINYNGGTTIAGTMILAKAAGIKVFATGGLGGVHRGAEKTFDISADLTELGRTNVAVVSSGSKAFLDLEKTLEYLETQGVYVSTFGRRNERVDFPAFYSRESGLKSPNVVETPAEAASIIRTSHELGLTSGQLFCNPIQAEHEIPKEQIDEIIVKAIAHAEKSGVKGKDNTPFILNEIKKLSGGNALGANIALVVNNAFRGAEIASELSKLYSSSSSSFQPPPQERQTTFKFPTTPPRPSRLTPNSTSTPKPISAPESTAKPTPKPNIQSPETIVVGSIALDVTCHHKPLAHTTPKGTLKLHTSNPVEVHESIGGVGHNIALASYLVGGGTRLISVVRNDSAGKAIVDEMQSKGMDATGIRTITDSKEGGRTARYVSINENDGELYVAAADMSIIETHLDGTHVAEQIKAAAETGALKYVCLDGNLTPDVMESILTAIPEGVKVAFEPTSTAKSTRVISLPSTPISFFPAHRIDLITPNQYELDSLFQAVSKEDDPLNVLENSGWFKVIDALNININFRTKQEFYFTATHSDAKFLVQEGHLQKAIRLAPIFPFQLVKFGDRGVLAVKIIPVGASADENPALVDAEGTRQEDAGIMTKADPTTGIDGLWIKWFPVKKKVVTEDGSVSGAGDTFAGVVLTALAKGKGVVRAVELGMKAASVTVGDRGTVSAGVEELKRELLE